MRFVLCLALSLALPAMAKNGPLCRSVFQADVGTTDELQSLLRRAEDLRSVRKSLRDAQLPTPDVDRDLADVKRMVGRRMILSPLQATAARLDEVIITRHYSEASLSTLSRSSAPKPMDLHVKTARDGLLAGFVPREPLLSEPGLSPDKLRFLQDEVSSLLVAGVMKTARLSEFVDHREAIDPEILTDSSGHPVTSDVDLWGILRRETTGESARLVPELGWVAPRDERTIETINSAFHRIDPRELRRDLVQHGPWVAHPEARESDYPLWAFEPTGQVRRLANGDELRAFLAELGQRGYKL